MTKVVVAADGRNLAVETCGKPDGSPVFLLHGTPGSRYQPRPRSKLLHLLGVRLISFDRPGYGDSDRMPNRIVGDIASDVATIADALGIDKFTVVGRSGGAPHALACAALLPHRATRVAALVALAPRKADGLDWFEGMIEANIVEFTVALAGQRAVASRLHPVAQEIRADPARKVLGIYEQAPDADRRVVADHGIRRMLERNFAEALRTSADGWVDDILALTTHWGFAPDDIRVPTLLWHGENDVYAPVGHTRWLATRIPHATVRIQRGAAHFDALAVLPQVLRWLIHGAEPLRSVAVPGPC